MKNRKNEYKSVWKKMAKIVMFENNGKPEQALLAQRHCDYSIMSLSKFETCHIYVSYPLNHVNRKVLYFSIIRPQRYGK